MEPEYNLNYIVSAKFNMLVTDSLKEVYRFLKDLQARGITYAHIVGSKQSVRLTENGFWVWTQAEEPKCAPTSKEATKNCST